MRLDEAIFFAFISAYLAILVVRYWAKLLGNDLSGNGLLITALLFFLTVFLFLLFGPESLFAPAAVIGTGIVVITLISFWITS